MTKVTNTTRQSMDFIVGVKDGDPVTEALGPGETKDMAIDLASAQVRGRIHVGAISVPKTAERQAAKQNDAA